MELCSKDCFGDQTICLDLHVDDLYVDILFRSHCVFFLKSIYNNVFDELELCEIIADYYYCQQCATKRQEFYLLLLKFCNF
jgi:hypothetical protein